MGGLCGSFQFAAKYHEFELVWVTTLVRMQLQCQALVATSSGCAHFRAFKWFEGG